MDEFIISDRSESSSLHVFPQEDLTPTDFWMWKEAILQLCSGTTTLPTVLGRYVCPPHTPCGCFGSADNLQLYQIDDDPTRPSFCIYNVRQGHGTRHGNKYDWASNKLGLHPGMHYASVLMFGGVTCAIMRSKTPICVPITPPTFFLERLDSHGNCSLWENLSYDGDGEWIRGRLRSGS